MNTLISFVFVFINSKAALLEFANLTDCSTAAFSQIHVNICNAIESVDPSTEYRDFVTQHRCYKWTLSQIFALITFLFSFVNIDSH